MHSEAHASCLEACTNITDGACIVAVYVDDILIMDNNNIFMVKTNKILQETFEMEDLGSV